MTARPLAAALLALLVMAGPAAAAPVVATALSGPNAPSTTTDEVTFAGDVSNSDLLHGIAGTGGSWNGNGSSPAGLNDADPGGDFDDEGNPGALDGTSWARDGDGVSFREFELGTGSGAGFDITGIQSIAAWSGAGFSNQKYEVRVRLVGAAGFPAPALLTVDYQPFTAALNEGGSTKVNVTDDTGILASGVEAIRFDILDTTSNNAGGAVIRELDVFGTETVVGPDETPPTISGLSPADNSTGVPPGSNLVATFDEDIAIGTGDITIKNLDAPSQSAIPVGDARVSVSDAVLTINPTTDLAPGTNYAIQIDASAIDDTAGNSFVGMIDNTTWNFTTGVPDLTAPTILTVSPADNSSDVPLTSDLVATFDEDIAVGTGTITLKDLDTPSQTVITLPDARVAVSGTVLTINPGANLSTTTNYAVQINAGAVMDASGNPFAGIDDDTTWNFRSAEEPLRIMCLGDSITVGYTDNPGWNNHPFMFGYRSGLYTRLTDAGYNFQFVGASTEPWTGISGDPTHGGTVTPPLDIRDFGQDGHRGYGGAGIWGNVNAWIAADNPDVILLLIGINGIGGGSPGALNTLVNSIVTTAPDVHLIVAQITPRATFNQALFDYNVYIRDTLVPTYAGAGHKVTTVDLYSLFLTDPSTYTTLPSTSGAIEPGVLSNNINHPDNPHYDLMAQEWFEGIEALGLGPDDFSSWISDPAFGLDPADQGFGADPDRDRIPNALEAWFGTHPGEFNAGVGDLSTDGTTTTFTHPKNENPPSDLSGFYQWSLNLDDWYAGDGVEGPPGGPTVAFVPNTIGTTTSVTATASEPLDNLFLRAGVMQN